MQYIKLNTNESPYPPSAAVLEADGKTVSRDGSYCVAAYAELAAENGRYEIRSITVTLRNLAIFADPHAIVDFVDERWNCPCTVIYE